MKDPIVLKSSVESGRISGNSRTKKDNNSHNYATSQFRGVSKNGKKWQVMAMGNNCKYFSGSIPY